jgi:hypothetical protein
MKFSNHSVGGSPRIIEDLDDVSKRVSTVGSERHSEPNSISGHSTPRGKQANPKLGEVRLKFPADSSSSSTAGDLGSMKDLEEKLNDLKWPRDKVRTPDLEQKLVYARSAGPSSRDGKSNSHRRL